MVLTRDWLNALGGEKLARDRGAPGGKRDVVLPGAAFIGVTLDLHRDVSVLLEPFRLLGQRLLASGVNVLWSMRK